VEIKCTQCGAGVEIKEDSGFLACPYCDSRLYLESDRTVRHFFLQPEIRPEQVSGAVSRELFTRELKGPVQVGAAEPFFIPFWLLRMKDGALRFPAAELENLELQKFAIPAGKLVPYDSSAESQYRIETPDLSLDQLMQKPALEEAKDRIERSDLIHVPFYKVAYSYQGASYQAMVDAVEGGVYAEQMPAGISGEKDAYFMTLFVILSLVFVAEAFILRGFWLTLLGYAITSAAAWQVVSRLLDRKGY